MINLGTYSGKNCPNVRFKPNVIDRMLEGLAFLVQLALWGCIYWIYTQKGGVISSGIWIMGGLSTFTFILLGVCSYGPVRIFNFPVRVDERNIAIQYLLAVRFVRVLNVLLGLFFLSTAFMEYYKWVPIFFSVTLVLQAIAFIVYFVMAHKYK